MMWKCFPQQGTGQEIKQGNPKRNLLVALRSVGGSNRTIFYLQPDFKLNIMLKYSKMQTKAD